jgi:predicted Zn-dependent peptidase
MNVEISRLPNGLTVVTDPMPQLQSAAVGIWVNCGARHEARPVMGISHMLEHMAFKGTERRSARDIAEEIEAVGGFLNAYTSREQTAFHVRTLEADVPLAVDILSDILTRPTFDPVELERERQVILQEIGQARDTPDDIVFDHLQLAVYPDQAMGRPILGDEATVGALSRDQLKTYMANHYTAGSMVLVASGAVRHAEMLALAERYLSGVPQGSELAVEPARYGGQDVRVDDDLEQLHVTYGFPGVASADDDLFVAQVYVTALGGGMSSRLFQEAREKRGLCYSIYAFANSFADGGMLGVYTGTGASEAGEISAVVAGEMAALAETADEREVARARAQLKSSLLMGLERPSSRSEQIASQLYTYGRVRTAEDLIEKLEAVDAKAVRAFGERVMATRRPAIAAVGPVAGLESHDAFSRRFAGSSARDAAA